MKLYWRVLDENNQPVAGAVVTVLWQGCSRTPRMVSDELGMFYFEGPSDRAYRLEASAGGRYGVSESKGGSVDADIIIRLKVASTRE